MCGICGLFSLRGGMENPERPIGAMVAALAHRGPDASGVHVDDRAALGSTRLAIIDLVGGDPPIYSEDRSVCLVYNGEVYDHLAIRSRLERLGHVFASATDSEAVVHAYEQDGIGSVAALNGMFAFAIWDTRRGELHLARDRFGQKPLYYHWDGTTLVFASEIKALLASGRVPVALDPDAMVEALTFQNIVSMRSIVRNVSMVPPGSTLKVDGHGLSITRYFDPMPKPDPAIDAREAAKLVEKEFTHAVERHLMSDVDVASYLSGGLDTGSIAAIASATLPRLSTFCIGFDVSGAEGLEAGFDELDDARVLAETLGTHHHDLRLDASDMEMVLPRMMRHLEEPRMNFSYPNYLAAGLTSRWVKVVLSGAGGDELFGGYPWRYAHGAGDDFPNSYFSYWNRLLTPDELRDALLPDVLEQVDLERPRAVFDEVMQESEGLPNLDRILYYESRTYLHGLLVLEDKLSMAHSLESRVPFLDHELVDLALAIPAAQKVFGPRSKELFRQAVADILPSAVVSRRKTGFTPPQGAWFRGPQAAYVRRVLTERADSRRIFRPRFLERVLKEHESGARERHHLIWTLLCLEWWHRIFIDREHAK
ncbi:MAG: asparagine synthase (glutamine-hydrolyzing) [Gaiellaceae bacterium]